MAATRQSSRLLAEKQDKDDNIKRKRDAGELDVQNDKVKHVKKKTKTTISPTKKPIKVATTTNNRRFEFSAFTIENDGKFINCENRGITSESKTPWLIFTHGAGGGLSAPATTEFTEGFSLIAPVTSFEGVSNLKSRIKSFHSVLAQQSVPKALGGRSMGARAAVIAAQESDQKPEALILVSYPLRGGTKNDLRDQILLEIPKETIVLFISGDKDSMCDISELNTVRDKMAVKSWLITVTGADHGMSLTPKTATQNVRRETGRIAASWLEKRDEKKRYCTLAWDSEAEEVTGSQTWTKK